MCVCARARGWMGVEVVVGAYAGCACACVLLSLLSLSLSLYLCLFVRELVRASVHSRVRMCARVLRARARARAYIYMYLLARSVLFLVGVGGLVGGCGWEGDCAALHWLCFFSRCMQVIEFESRTHTRTHQPHPHPHTNARARAHTHTHLATMRRMQAMESESDPVMSRVLTTSE